MGVIKRLPIGLEIYGVRAEFAADPEGTLAELGKMGYAGVEFYGGIENNLEPSRCVQALAAANLKCLGFQPNWDFILEDTLEDTLRYSAAVGNRRIGIASAPPQMLTRRDTLEEVIKTINKAYETAAKAGFQIGYHAHKTDFVVVDGKTAWDRIFEATPKDFAMILDTGNALAGGAWSVPLLEKFPQRSPWVHIKPYSFKDQGATMIGEDDFDWPVLLKACVELGGADTMTIEYSNNARYDPMTASRLCIQALRGYMD